MNLEALVRESLREDVGTGDITTEACVDVAVSGRAEIRAKAALVVCGHAPAQETFGQVGADYVATVADGERVAAGTVVATVEGSLRALLTGERVALNFLMRLSGIASHTRACTSIAKGLRVVDTRKTTPVHRLLEKHAVRMGGGHNHRFALYDAILIKENHIMAAGGVQAAVERAKSAANGRFDVQVEVEALDQIEPAISAGADALLLDNMDDGTLRAAVGITNGRVLLEASGGMTAERLPSLVNMGLDRVSMGGLIHQARWVDLSMRVVETSVAR
jgi:nicotinate-nucleotide pyrophosphorylase (carboxylating)